MKQHETQQSDPGLVVVVAHPSYWEEAERCHFALRGSDLASVHRTILESGETPEENRELLQEKLPPGKITVAHVCGDGSWNGFHKEVITLARSRIEADRIRAESITSISVAGGNGRDVGRAQHGRRHMNDDPAWLIAHSRQVAARAIEIEATVLGKEPGATYKLHDMAMSYMGAGQTAEVTARLVKPQYKNGKKYIRDLRLGFGVLFEDIGFDIWDNEGLRTLSDLTIAKGHCEGKVGYLNTEYEKDEMLVIKTGTGLVANSLGALGLMTNLRGGIHTREPYTFTPLSKAQMHIDGDPPLDLAINNPVTASLTEVTYNMLVTRHAKQSRKPRQSRMIRHVGNSAFTSFEDF